MRKDLDELRKEYVSGIKAAREKNEGLFIWQNQFDEESVADFVSESLSDHDYEHVKHLCDKEYYALINEICEDSNLG